MRRFTVLAVTLGVMLSSLGSPVAAETNPDPLQRLRFTSNVTSVDGSHPNLQVGDIFIFELAYESGPFPIFAPQSPDDADFCGGAVNCVAYDYDNPGTWQVEYRRNGELVHSEDGTFASIVMVEGGDSEGGGSRDDVLHVFADTNRDDHIAEFQADSSWDASGDLGTMWGMVDQDDLWHRISFWKHLPTWWTYQWDDMTADGHARVSVPAGLNFDVNGGVGGPDRISGDPEEVVTVPATEPTRDGYQFVSWNTASDGSGAAYDPGDSFTLGSSSDVETVYAQWTDQALAIVVPETSVPETTDAPTPSDVTLPATGSSGGTVSPVLFVLGLGGLLMLFGRRRTPDRQ